MSVLIGIVTRNSLSEEKHKTNIIYNNIINSISKNGGIGIGIVLDENYKEIVNMCDGIIFQGGNIEEKYDVECIKYIHKINKPLLGICLGMQLMGLAFNGILTKVNFHKENNNHIINIKENTVLYQIMNKKSIIVNSRHNYIISNTTLNVSATSNENYIECIEDSNKKFFLGVQWHPEDMNNYNIEQNNIFKYFINRIVDK